MIRSETNAAYARSGHLLFMRDGVLRAQPFDIEAMRVTGQPAVIAPVQAYLPVSLFSASDDGRLVYVPPMPAMKSELVLKNRRGERVASFAGPAFHFAPRLSPDGSRIAADRSDDTALGDIWIIGRDGASRISFDGRNETAPVWSPSGDEVIYSRDLSAGGVQLLRQRIGGRPQVLLDGGTVLPADWSPDGRHLALDRGLPIRSTFDVTVLSLPDRRWINVAATPANEGRGCFSPDGRWIAYHSDESGRHEIYVQPFPPDGTKHQVSPNGGITPRWSKSGEIFWVDLENRLQAAKVQTVPSFHAGPPEPLFAIDQRLMLMHDYDLTPDGNFLVNEWQRLSPRPLTLLVNWQKRLK